MRVAFHNLGCKVNSYELDIVRQQFLEAGYEEVPFDQEADVYIVNTCSVTNIADRKSRQMLHRAKRENPAAVVIAMGCYVETAKDVLSDGAVDLAVGNKDKKNTLAILRAYEKSAVEAGSTGKAASGAVLLKHAGRTRADIKIQDGCNQFCTYCIIPYARGRIESRPQDEILSEIRQIAADGIREVVLSGIHISSYGRDEGRQPEDALPELLDRIAEIPDIERIRISSVEPGIMTQRFIDRAARNEKLCPHFHMSLQSGCDRTLKRMNRHYSADEYYESVLRLREAYGDPAITTDVIVGFPDETQQDFEASKAFLEKVNFYQIHVFKYSRRSGTPAAMMDGQIPEREKARRSDILLELTAQQAAAYRAARIGRQEAILPEDAVLVDGRKWFRGHTERYVEYLIPEEAAASGRMVRGTAAWLKEEGGLMVLKDLQF